MTGFPAHARRPLPRRSRMLISLAATLPLILLAGLLVLPGAASAGVPVGPDLVVSMSDAPDPVAPGGSVTITILVSNQGNDDSYSTSMNFFTGAVSIVSADTSQGEGCTSEGTSVSCDLGYIPGAFSSGAAPAPALAFNEAQVTIVVAAPDAPGSFESTATADSSEQTEQNPGDNSDTETTTVSSGDSDSGTIPPGGSLSTVNGTQGNPVTQSDPFALTLKNSSNQALDASIAEEPCDGTQSGDPLCTTSRLGGVLGNFQFQPATTLRVLGAVGPVVTVGKLYYDRTLARLRSGFKIFYQKQPGDPVVRLPRCDPLETECFRVKKLASGDQVVRVAFSTDPRITRG
jgi:hypothetical protein